jgi:hypothetical protein
MNRLEQQVIEEGSDHAMIRQRVNAMLDEKFEIEHATLQLEAPGDADGTAGSRPP